MASDSHNKYVIDFCKLVDLPDEVEAGARLTLQGEVSCSPQTDLTGKSFLIKDQKGTAIKCVELAEFKDSVTSTTQFTVDVPVVPGVYCWSIVCPAHEESGTWYGDEIMDFSFTVNPHVKSLVVWNVPPAIQCGEKFSINLGVKCLYGCLPHDWVFQITNEDGVEQSNVLVGDDHYSGTESLFYRSIELKAPKVSGLYEWNARTQITSSDALHEESSTNFNVRVVSEPQFLLTVIAIDSETKKPIEGVQVFAHPYREFTDKRGIAKIKVPKGAYRVFVSGQNYFPFREDNLVEKDLTIQVELALDEGISDADVWS